MSALTELGFEFLAPPLSGADAAAPPLYHLATIWEPGEALPGAVTITLPVSENEIGYVGAVAASPLDDIYETIWVVPALLDVGRITASVRREVEVWNAYTVDERTLESVSATADDGITTSGVALPYTFAPLGNAFFTVDVSPNGPATIGANYDLNFSTVERGQGWAVEGVRIIEWTTPPNWADRYEETFAFSTEIITSFNGTEQRLARRHRPRRTLAFTPLVSDTQDREMKRLLSTWQNRTFAMADWPRGVPTNGVPAGGQTVWLLEPNPDLEVGGLLVLRHKQTSQVIEIEAIDNELVTLNSPVLQAFPAGTKAYKGLIVHADASLSGRRLNSRVGRLRAQFREMHVPQKLTPPAAPLTWRGLEAFLTRPNWARDITLESNWEAAWLDSGHGAFDYRVPVDAPADVRKFTYLARDREEVRALREAYHRLKGRRGEVFVPTWDDDLPYVSDLPLIEGAAQLSVADARDSLRMVSERVYRNICVRLVDGTILLRHVTGGSDGPAGPQLVLDEGWPRNIAPEEILTIHWMPKCRLGSDDLTVDWVTDQVAEVSLAFTTLPDIIEGDL